ncbi:MAG TPA: serine hydrolase domain-containing protein [Acidimicrobiales bacterium]
MTRLVDEKIDQLRARARREIDDGLLPSCQFALAIDGEVVLQETYGAATGANRYAIFSATKPIVASAVWLLMQEGGVDVSRPVAHYFPEFADNGKDAVTVEQVMLHTAGFPRAPLGPPAWFDREARVKKMASWRLNWEPGTRFEYHATSAHWVLGEIVERVGGRDCPTFVCDEILRPLGLLPRLRLGVPVDEQGDILDLAGCGEAATSGEIMAVYGIPELPATEVTEDAMLRYNEAEVRSLGVPGAGAFSDASSVALYYQALLHNPRRLWSPRLLEDVTSRVRNTLRERLLGYPANRTLGLIVAGDDGRANQRGFGRTGSPSIFGHNGAAGQLAWADPETGLSFCYLTNGIDRHSLRLGRRGVALSSIAAECAKPA